MNQEEQHLRLSAQKEFLNSLDQLQETLLTGESEMPKSQTPRQDARTTIHRQTPAPAPAPLDAGALEAAVADIEEFIKSQHFGSGNGDC